VGATHAFTHDRPSHGCVADLLPSGRQPVTDGADSIKLSASSHRKIFWNPTTQKKKSEPLQRRRVTQMGRRAAAAATRRDETRQGETAEHTNAACHQPVALSTARLLTVVIRVQILRHCVRQSTTHCTGWAHLDHSQWPLPRPSCWPAPRRHVCPLRPTSRSVSDLHRNA
jgi:hypothetical protein